MARLRQGLLNPGPWTETKTGKPSLPRNGQNVSENVCLGLFSDEESEPGPKRLRGAQGNFLEARETRLAQEWPERVRKRPFGTIFGKGNRSPARSGQEGPREAQGKPRKPSWLRNGQNASENVRLGQGSSQGQVGVRPGLARVKLGSTHPDKGQARVNAPHRGKRRKKR